jgi:hypothetical protein
VVDARPGDVSGSATPNVAIPAAFIGFAFAGGSRSVTRSEGTFVGLVCGLVAVLIESPVTSWWITLVIEAAVVSAPLVLMVSSRIGKRAPDRASRRGI